MRGLTADIPDQTCKTAAQSRTRFVGHRQLPWIQFTCSCFSSQSFPSPPRDCGSIRRCGLSGMMSQGSMRAQFALALDYFGGKLEIGLAADAFEIVHQDRLAVGRRLGDPP